MYLQSLLWKIVYKKKCHRAFCFYESNERLAVRQLNIMLNYSLRMQTNIVYQIARFCRICQNL